MNRISSFLRGRQAKPENKVERSLPANFAEELLNLQLQVQANTEVPIETINRLIELYSIAVEYYESIQNPKYSLFKTKITKLLINPTVNRTMVDSCPTKQPKQQKQNKLDIAQHIEERRRTIENNLAFAMQSLEEDVRGVLIEANQRLERLRKMVEVGLGWQECLMKKRLGKRKKYREVGSRQSTEDDQQSDGHKKNQLTNEIGVSKDEMLQGSPKWSYLQQEEAEKNKIHLKKQQQKQQILKQIEVQVARKKKEQADNSYIAYLLSPQEIQRRRSKIQKKKSRKKVLTLKLNQSAQLPSEFNIPF